MLPQLGRVARRTRHRVVFGYTGAQREHGLPYSNIYVTIPPSRDPRRRRRDNKERIMALTRDFRLTVAARLIFALPNGENLA